MTSPHGVIPQQRRDPRPAVETHRSMRSFDGVICFGGEDWWYHNRGHYDMQMMRELSAHVPVLYINSIGMRTPRVGEGAMFFKRIARKLRSLRRGMVRVRDNFAVFSPVAAPGRLGKSLNPRLMPRQIRGAARKLGIRAPLVWVACPPGVEALEALDPVGVVYQRTDRFENYKDVDAALIRSYDQRLKQRADVTLFCASLLYDGEREECADAVFIDHGVDYEPFARAGEDPSSEPPDVRELPRPRVGFVGGIDAHTFDPPLFVEVARALPEVTFVLVGACSLPDDWCALPNVALLGQRDYQDVPGYMAACDVLIMPWNRSEWIEACNPIKLKEYLAVGRPIVSTSFYELRRYDDVVSIADGAEAFAQAIRRALERVGDESLRSRQRDRVREQTWTAKAGQVLQALCRKGLEPAARSANNQPVGEGSR